MNHFDICIACWCLFDGADLTQTKQGRMQDWHEKASTLLFFICYFAVLHFFSFFFGFVKDNYMATTSSLIFMSPSAFILFSGTKKSYCHHRLLDFET